MANVMLDEIDVPESTLRQLSAGVFNLGRLIRARDERRPEYFRIDESAQAVAGPNVLARMRTRRPARDPRAECDSFASQWDLPRSL